MDKTEAGNPLRRRRVLAKNKVLADATQAISVVRCVQCGKLHPVDTDGYVVIYGDIMVGADGEVLAGNINDKGKVVSSTVYCRGPNCLALIFRGMLGTDNE